MPLPRSTRFSRLSAKKPTDLLSGDQNGNVAPSVPRSGSATVVSSRRFHSTLLESLVATNTIVLASGDNAKEKGSVVGGV